MSIVFKRAPAPISLTPPETTSTSGLFKAEVKKVIKIGGGVPSEPKPAPAPATPMSVRQQEKLVSAGLMTQEQVKYPLCHVGDFVEITNTMFPWVKHYAPGDIARVKMVPGGFDAIHSAEERAKNKLHVLEITNPTDKSRKGQSAALFRWEFKGPVPNPNTNPTIAASVDAEAHTTR